MAESYLTGNPVAVCGTAGPGVTHLINALLDARKEGAAVIAIAGDVESKLIDTSALEELNPYKFFEVASLYTGRLVNPEPVSYTHLDVYKRQMKKEATQPSARIAATPTIRIAMSVTPIGRFISLCRLGKFPNSIRIIFRFGPRGIRSIR